MKISRKSFLAGAGSLLFLPQLQALANDNKKAPERLVFLSFGFGFTDMYYPKEYGKAYKLTPSLVTLEKHKNDFTMIDHLNNKLAANPHGGSESYLTSANVYGTPGKKFHNSISVDQVAAPFMGKSTRFTSMQLSSKSKGDGHGQGSSLSWNANGKSMSGIDTPFALYNMLFGGEKLTYEQRIQALEKRKSVLDTYVSSLKSLKGRASKMDKERLEQYFQTLREIELRIAKEKLWAKTPKPEVKYKEPKKELNGVDEIKTMYDLMILAMQTDSSRVFTYRQPLDNLLKAIGLPQNPHELSHWGSSPANKKANLQREIKQTELFAYFIEKLKTTKDFDGTRLFDNCLVSYGSNIRSGHGTNRVPTIITGNIKGKLKHGSHIEMPKGTELSNLWLTMLQTAEIPVDNFSDSTGAISEILV